MLRRKTSLRQASAAAAARALRRAQRLAAKAGVELTAWEDEFLGSVEQRVRTYGRAFADPEKGAAGAPLSTRQSLKLKQIVRKAKAATPSRTPEPAPSDAVEDER